MEARLFPAGRGIKPFTHEWLVKTAKKTRPVPYVNLEIDHFRPSDNKAMYWPPSRIDILRILSIAEQVKAPGKDLPVILDIGAATGLLSYLMARPERAAVLGIDPYAPYMLEPAYHHHNLRFCQAGIEWAIANHAGEIDLAVWSWPLIGLEPLEKIRALDPRAALLIFDMRDWQVGLKMTDWVRYVYRANFDDFRGFRKTLFWKGVNYLQLKQGASFVPHHNLFLLYVNERVDVRIEIPQKGETMRDYPWIMEAQQADPKFPTPTSVQVIDDGYILCPEGEYF